MAKPKKEKQRGKQAEGLDLSTLRATLFGEPPVSRERPARRRRLSQREEAEQLLDQALDEPVLPRSCSAKQSRSILAAPKLGACWPTPLKRPQNRSTAATWQSRQRGES